MITLKNAHLTATFQQLGAELKSLVMDGRECIWPGHPDVWKCSCPILFPICGGLKEDAYIYNGKRYSLPKHGFARTSVFALESQTDTQAVFLLTSSRETREQYPFDFALRVTYTLVEQTLQICYTVENRTEGEMYFSIGSHEGYFTPEGIEDYDVLFPEKETLNTQVLCGLLLSGNELPIIREQDFLPLYEKYFMIDTLIFKELRSRSATLRNRKTGSAIRVDFPDAKHLMIWHKPSAPFLCLEPWSGIADSLGSTGRLEEKESILRLERGGVYTNVHSITVL